MIVQKHYKLLFLAPEEIQSIVVLWNPLRIIKKSRVRTCRARFAGSFEEAVLCFLFKLSEFRQYRPIKNLMDPRKQKYEIQFTDLTARKLPSIETLIEIKPVLKKYVSEIRRFSKFKRKWHYRLNRIPWKEQNRYFPT